MYYEMGVLWNQHRLRKQIASSVIVQVMVKVPIGSSTRVCYAKSAISADEAATSRVFPTDGEAV
jgi:hypothetical protein